MKQTLLFFASIWVFLCTTGVQAQVKIGYMNPSVILAQLDEVTVVDQLIEQLVQERDSELMSKANQLQKDFVAYEEARSMLNEEARVTRKKISRRVTNNFKKKEKTILMRLLKKER